MNILVDLLRWGEGGTRTYARNVVRTLAQEDERVHVVCDPEARDELFTSREFEGRIHVPGTSVKSPYLRAAYQRSALPGLLKTLETNVYFVPAETSGMSTRIPGLRTVRMLRNMLPFDDVERRRYSFLRDPAIRVRLEILRRAMLRGLRSADRVIFISKASAEWMSRAANAKDNTIIYHGIEAFPADASRVAEARARWGLSGPFLLYVSALQPYKRQLEVLDSYEGLLRDRDDLPQLVLAGPTWGRYGADVVKSCRHLSATVRLLGDVPAPDVRLLMHAATLLVFASTCECCPNILLEYLAAGRAIVSSHVPPMPEIGGDAPLYCDIRDARSFRATLERAIADPALREAMSALAAKRAGDFRIERTVSETRRAIAEW